MIPDTLPVFVPQPFVLHHTRHVLDSYTKWTGKPLLPYESDTLTQARNLFYAPFVVATSNNAVDPILNYGNQKALELWELPWEKFTQTLGRQTAEPVHQAKRDEFLKTVQEKGFIDNYSGIRISSTGRRFKIEQATVWNVVDEFGKFCGQAATFNKWQYL